jgi:pseudaminic acid cytidylyltransferase
MKVAIIPARGGSKRIPRKNVKSFNGKPMIAWSIETALSAQCFDQVIVSTDDDEIAEIAQKRGAWVPFRRPVELADDHTGALDVIRHALRWLADNGQAAELACCIYATAPFIRADDLRRGLSLLSDPGILYALTVTDFPFPVQRALRLTPDGGIAMMQPEHAATRSQDLEHAWHDAGQFCWGRAAAFERGDPVFSATCAPVLIPRYRVQDIDVPDDWVRAEVMHRVISQMQ